VALVMARPDAPTLAAAATLFARLAGNASRIIPVDTESTTAVLGQRPAIFIGAAGLIDPSVFAATGIADATRDSWKAPAAPVPTGAGVKAPPGTGSGASLGEEDTRVVFDRWQENLSGGTGVKSVFKRFSDWLARMFDFSFTSLRITPAREVAYEPSLATSLVIAQGESPLGGATWTVLTSPDAAVLARSMSAITALDKWYRVGGRLTSFQLSDGAVSVEEPASTSYVASQPFSIGNMRLVIANWLSTNIMSYALALVLLCVALGIGTAAVLARLGRRS
jgi:hypothetical protein